MGCNSCGSTNPCGCSEPVPVRESGPPGIPGPAGATPVLTIAPTLVGPTANVTLVQTGPNQYTIQFTIPGSTITQDANIWLQTQTFAGPAALQGPTTVGLSGFPQPFTVYGQVFVPQMDQFVPNANECMVGQLGLGSDGKIKYFIGEAPNNGNNSQVISPLTFTGATASTDIGPALNIVLACPATVRVRASIDLENWVVGSGVTVIMMGVYVDGVLRGQKRFTNYEGTCDFQFYIDSLGSGAHSVQIRAAGIDALQTGSVDVFTRLLDCRW